MMPEICNRKITVKTMPDIIYEINGALTAEEFIAVLKASTLAEKRPVEDSQSLP